MRHIQLNLFVSVKKLFYRFTGLTMEDSLPILAGEDTEWGEGEGDQPDAKFSELPPPYSEHENLQVFLVAF